MLKYSAQITGKRAKTWSILCSDPYTVRHDRGQEISGKDNGGGGRREGEGRRMSWCKVTRGERARDIWARGEKKRREGEEEKGEEKRWRKKKDVCWVWVRESDRSPGRFRSAIRAALLSVRLAACVCVCARVFCYVCRRVPLWALCLRECHVCAAVCFLVEGRVCSREKKKKVCV